MDRELVRKVREGNLFNYHKIRGIKIHCAPSLAPYVVDQPLHSRQTVEKHADKSFTVSLPEATEYEAASWVLAQAGLAKLVAPKSLKATIAKKAMEIANAHSGR